MKGRTWPMDSQGLFDQNCDKVTRSVHRTSSNCTLFRIANQTHLSFDFKKPTSEDISYMAYIHLQNGYFSVLPIQTPKGCYDKIWLVTKSLEPTGKIRGYCLSEGDVVKLGRVKIRVREINTETSVKGFTFENYIMSEESEEYDHCLLYTSDAADE